MKNLMPYSNGPDPCRFHSAPAAGRTAVLLGLLWAAPAACQKPVPPAEPTAGVIGGETDLDALWDRTLVILRRHGFEPDRQDRAMGVITTLPTTSMQWHEPWRQDVADGYSLLDSSLHTTQRLVTVRFVKTEEWSMDVQVDVQRLSTPETQISTASSVLHGLSGRLPTVEGELFGSGRGAPPREWVQLRRDGMMEERLLHQILAYAAEPDLPVASTH